MSSKALLEAFGELKLEAFSQAFQALVQEEPQEAERLERMLLPMAKAELASRTDRAIARRIRSARFIEIKTAETFDFEDSGSVRKVKKRYLRLLETDFVAEGLGAIFCGSTGLGKTHLAKALGYRACQRNQAVLYRPCSQVLNTLAAAQAAKDLESALRQYVAPSLLVLDELGYMTMSAQEANLFFQVVSRRHERQRPIVATTNKPFKEWNQVFSGDATAHAIVDRLTERAEIFYLEGVDSYRKRHRKTLPAA
jgi:DNA replication protein DnaC